MNPISASVTMARPTRVRYWVLFLLCLLAMITYVDRAVIGSSKESVMAAVGRPATDFYWLLVAFQLAYALFEVPTGWMGDTFGPRSTLIRIVIWWSSFIALTGLAGYGAFTYAGERYVIVGFYALIVMQFFFGMGEAGAFPNITRALYNWFPATSRGFAQGSIWMSARLMGGLTPLLWLTLTEFLGLSWRQGFWLLAGVSLIWVLVFMLVFRNRPEEHPHVNAAERELTAQGKSHDMGGHSGVPWGRLIVSRNLWAICAMYFCMNFGWYFFLYFLPGFMKEQFLSTSSGDADKVLVALLTGGPLLIGVVGCSAGGFLSDLCVRRFGRRWGRRWCGLIGFGLAGLCFLGAIAGSSQVWTFAACVALAGFFNDLSLASCWAICQDVGRRYAAIVAGSMNMIGNLGGALTNFVTGSILQSHSDASGQPTMSGYILCLSLYATAFLIGVGFWLCIDASRPVVDQDG